MTSAVSIPSILVNNVAIGIVPNSFSYTEGFGEQNLRVQSAGGRTISQVYSDNAEMKYSDIKWEMVNTEGNIELVREWKSNTNQNTIEVTDINSNLTRFFTNAALINNYEVNLSVDGTLSLEWKSNAAK